MILKIVCPKCRGKVSTEYINDKVVDLVCVHCGLRRFYPKYKFNLMLLELERKIVQRNRMRSLLSTEG